MECSLLDLLQMQRHHFGWSYQLLTLHFKKSLLKSCRKSIHGFWMQCDFFKSIFNFSSVELDISHHYYFFNFNVQSLISSTVCM